MDYFSYDQLQRWTHWIGEKQWFYNLTGRIGWDPKPKKWIFILGCYNSGTSLLKRLIARHPDIGQLPREGVFLTDSLALPEDFGWNRMWIKCAEEMSVSDPDPESVAQRVKRHWSVWYPSSTPFLLEKSIANVPRAMFFERFFEPAYFIHIVRNGYAVAEGIQRRARPAEWGNEQYQDTYPMELCARQWSVSEQTIMDTRDDLSRFLSIRYEDLCERTSATVEKIVEFLDVQEIHDDMQSLTFDVGDKEKTIQNMNDDHFDRLTREEKLTIREVASDQLDYYGYDIVE